MTKPPIPLDRETHDLLIQILRRMSRNGKTTIPMIRNGSIDEGEDLLITSAHIGPGDPAEITVTTVGIFVADQQGVTIYRLDGSVTTASCGTIETTDPAISRIEVDDLRLVKGHAISTVHETVSHHLEFVGGGSFSFMTDGRGKVLETVYRDMKIRGESGGVLRLLGSVTGAQETRPSRH